MDLLREMRLSAGPKETIGLSDDIIEKFIGRDHNLTIAIISSYNIWKTLDGNNTYKIPEGQLIKSICDGWCHFYSNDTRNPYIPIGGKGPWMITLHGSVIHDSGGYGMLGLGHNPDNVINNMGNEYVMANIMTPSLTQLNVMNAIKNEIGHTRPNGCPYYSILMMNSGSEGNSVADRIMDIHTGQVRNNRPLLGLSLKGSFHGRTFRPAVFSSSCKDTYRKHRCESIISAQSDYSITVEPNNIQQLKQVFKDAEDEGKFIECVMMEAVMGEGNPGQQIKPEFYALARELTIKHDSILIIDSVQAGFRCMGVLSIMDYPNYQNLPPPDFEVFSKAINGGQYPVSILVMNERASSYYRHGVYGNTMTGNPRACNTVLSVLNSMNNINIRNNIVNMGKYAIQEYKRLQDKFPHAVVNVTGTGLLYAIHLHKDIPVVAFTGAEHWLRCHGIGVIHGGENALRFTPHFNVTKDEIDMQVAMVGRYLISIEGHMSLLKNIINRVDGHNKLHKNNKSNNNLVSSSSSEEEYANKAGNNNTDNNTITSIVKGGDNTNDVESSIILRGHLFDSQLINSVLDIVESHKSTVHFNRIRLGSSVNETSEVGIKVKAYDPMSCSLNDTINEITKAAESNNCSVTIINNNKDIIHEFGEQEEESDGKEE